MNIVPGLALHLCMYCLSLFALTVAWVRPARADVAVLRPLPAEPKPSASAVVAHEAVAEALAAANVKLISADEARSRLLAAAERPCLDVDCAGSVLRALDADMLVAVAVTHDGARAEDVLITLVDAEGRLVSGEAAIEGGDVASAARAVLNRALSKWPARGLIPLTVTGSPAGATVLVDGQPRGTLPLELRVQPGEHEVVVSMSGYESTRQHVDTGGAANQVASVHVELAREPAGGHVRRRRAHTIGAVLLASAGAVTIAGALASLARRGCEETVSSGACVRSREVDTLPLTLWLSGGALAVAGGVTWLGLSYRASKRSAHVDVGVRPTGLTIRGRF